MSTWDWIKEKSTKELRRMRDEMRLLDKYGDLDPKDYDEVDEIVEELKERRKRGDDEREQ